MDRESIAALMLHFYQGFSPSSIIKLHRKLGSFSGILASERHLLPRSFLTEMSQKMLQNLDELDRQESQLEVQAKAVLGWCQENAVYPLSLADTAYPPLLKEISLPPALLFVRGNVDILSLPQVAIVGSRNASSSGLNTAFEFAKMLASNGFVVTSGLALGIDGAAHAGAIRSGKDGQKTGQTIAVLGTGSDVIYPRQHRELHQEILNLGGTVITEFLPGTPPLPENFPRRNRIISGLSMGTMVVEAAIRSGSLITARYALEQGREVFAVPGSIHNALSKGSHALLKQGATLVESGKDIVEQLGGMLSYVESESSNPDPILEKQYTELLRAMGYDPIDIDTLVHRTGLSVAELNRQLVQLEMEVVIANSNGLYHRLK
jgi:DNA processing protein